MAIKGTYESTRALVRDFSAPLTHHDSSDLGSLILIQITPKEKHPLKVRCELLSRDSIPSRFLCVIVDSGCALVNYHAIEIESE